MYIDLNLIFFVLAVIGCVALIYLIIVLKNLNNFVKQTNSFLGDNKKSITESLVNLPSVIANLNHASENFKDVSEVVTDVTADIVVAKENVASNFEVASEVLGIIRNVFTK